MRDSNFVWTDLSTFDLKATKDFYTKVFGWQYQEDDEYHIGYVGASQAAGIYTMPEKFQKMGMPSFWMSYISVTDIDTVVAQAETLGGIIEIKPTDFGGQGIIALIRDPSGAGFTVWEGLDLGGKDDNGTPGRMAWNELYVSDAGLIINFYRTLFGWSFTLDRSYSGERYDIRNGAGTHIAALEVIPNEVKGKEQFWVPYFAVQNLEQTLNHIANEGGQVVEKIAGEAGNLALIADPQGAGFMLTESRPQSPRRTNINNVGDTNMNQREQGFFSQFKVRTFLALLFIYIAVIFNLQWMWGLLFLLWLIPDIMTGQAHLAEPISRDKNPIWYWLIILTWLWMSVYLLITGFM